MISWSRKTNSLFFCLSFLQMEEDSYVDLCNLEIWENKDFINLLLAAFGTDVTNTSSN